MLPKLTIASRVPSWLCTKYVISGKGQSRCCGKNCICRLNKFQHAQVSKVGHEESNVLNDIIFEAVQ